MQYKDFIIKIESKQGEDYIINIRSPAGEGTSKLRLPFKLDDAAGMMQKLAGTFRGALSPETDAEATREMSMSSDITTPSIELPKALFDSLFIGATKTLFDQSIGMIRGEDSGLRIKLQIDPTDSEVAALASLPWELLYREETRDYLNLSRNTPLVRYLNVQRPFAPESFVLPLRILVVMSSPEGVAPLNLEQERQLIEQSWARQSGVEVDFLERPATTQRLSDKLTEKDYHVLHYMGHGDFDRNTGHGVLLLEDENSQPQALDGQTLGGVILHDVKSLRLVFLNACDTAKATQQEGQDPFAGVATAMIMAGIPAVVAMQFPITDKAAVSFAGTFYPRIVSGYPVDAAVAEGRKAIKLADSSTMEWATPVLFMRSPDGVLFDIEKPMPAAEPLPKPVSKPPSNRTDDAAPAQKSQAAVTQATASHALDAQKPGMSNAMKGALGAATGLVLIVLAYFISSSILSSEAKIPPIAEKGYSVKQATDIVETAGLLVAPDIVGVASSKSEGVVLRTDPPEGINYDVDKEVKLVVSNGTIELESLEGKTEDEIRRLFETLPVSIMAVKNVVTLPAQGIADGTFVRSEPDANNAIPHDTEFTLYMGASGIPIPELVSLDLNEAIVKLKEVGLTYETRYELILDGKDGKIFKTDPAAGSRLVASAPVLLFISARGGWVYLKEVVTDSYTNNSAKTMRADDDNSGRKIGILKARETVKVIESKRNGWTLVRDNDQ
jgi:beta-lactam-binding protein with PASTA domain